jgi:uncharacterized protein (DUF1501 family)
MTMDRRRLLAGIACSAAAHPWLTTLTLAGSDGAALGENRLVVVILRGAMDGLDVVRPEADPAWAALRPGLSALPGLPLSQGFALHPGLAGLMPLWAAGELGFVHATSTPYRDKRSHFDGQDILEAGTGGDVPAGAARDGWLNRLLQGVPGVRGETAYAIGRDAMPVLAGPAEARIWSPRTRLALSPQGRLLYDHIVHDDALFREAAAEAQELSALTPPEEAPAPMTAVAPGVRQLADTESLVAFAAAKLRAETRIAAFSLAGWDTHRNQEAALRPALARLERVVLGLAEGLGADWGRTLVLAMTEFGRTVRENGSRGTDHGTGGAMLLAGGALAGGRVMGTWPGLDEGALYQGRDLMPTSDVRAWAGWALRGLYGLDRATLEGGVFPGLDLGADPGILR